MKRIHAFLLVTFAIIFGLLDTTTVCAADIVRGPYLQNATPNGVTIKWRTSVNETSKVWYGTSLPTLNQTLTDPNLETDHTIRISGLPSASKYFYQVGAVNDVVLAGGDANHYFVTSPPAGSTDPIRIWVLGDSGTADDKSRAVRDAYLELAASDGEADIWLMLGDNAYIGGSDTEYQNAVFNTYPEILRNKPLWSTRGNHEMSETVYYGIFDLPANGEGGGLASGTEHYYSFDYGNVHFICLNSEETALSSNPNSAMYQWLEQDLAGTLQDWIIAYWHHPPYSKGSHNSDTENQLIDMRENALPILEAGGVDLVLTGHSHSYERSSFLNGHYDLSGTFDPNVHVVQTGDGREDSDGAYQKCENAGAVYIVAGSSGTTGGGSLNHPAMQVSINSLGSLIIDVNDTRMDVFFLRENTSPIQIDDYLTIESGGPPGWCYGSADIDGDGEVDGKDYAALAVRWRDSGCGVCGGADLSGDEQVEFDDLWWFTENWPDTYRKQASDPLPIDDSNEINVYTVVSWSADSYASHDVYLGTSDPPALQGNQTGTSFDPCDLEYNTTYYWKINEVYSDGDIIEGQLWNFTTWAVAFDPNLNLVGWWEFEEGAGADANDSAGNNDGTLMGNPNWVPGKIGSYALDFDGVGDYVAIPHNDNLSLVSEGTVSAWINLNNTNGQGIVTKQPSGTDGNYYLRLISNGKMNFTITNGIWPQRVGATDPTVCPTGQWVLYTGTFDASFVKLYKNGVEVDSEPHTITPSASTANVNIGHWALTSEFANSVIDDVRIYNRTLSANEVLVLYQSGAN